MNVVFLICLALSQVTPQFLDIGQKNLRVGNWQEASDNFNKALGTNRLNVAGRAISYWSIYIAEKNMYNIDNSINALLSFMIYGVDFMFHNNLKLKNMAKEFKIKQKLSYSITVIQAIWARQNNYSCRSELFACYIPDQALIRIFESTIPFCGNLRNINSRRVFKKDNIINLEVQCLNKTETYYFTTKNEY